MLEGIILSVIALAVGYAVVMRMMSRRADVLYGEFIEGDELAGPRVRLP